ncbi:hypothetical protein [Tenacibaculum halocynthiae]|uniref:hypothetical protein n=1 Tax=Tenacibaculum halocynthiae TaxID=1254437 RepID=UPI003D654388
MKHKKETLKKYFEAGDKPTQEQFSDLIDSYIDSKQPEGEAGRRFIIDKNGEVSVVSEQKTSTSNLQEITDNGSTTSNKLTLENSFDNTAKVDLSFNEIAMLNSIQQTYLLQQRIAMLDSQQKLNFDVNNGSFTSSYSTTKVNNSINLRFPTEELKKGISKSAKFLKLPYKTGTLATLDDISKTLEETFSISTSSLGSTFTYSNSTSKKYKIGKRVFIDIVLSGVTSDGNATNNYIQIDGFNEISSFYASGTIVNRKNYEINGVAIESSGGSIRFKDHVWNDDTLIITINFLGDGSAT